MFIKLLIILITLINFSIPFTSIIDIGFIGLLILFLISTKINYTILELISIKKFSFFSIIILSIINLTLPKLSIEEAHSIFLSKNDINIISEFIPNQISKKIRNDYNNLDVERIIKSYGGNSFNSVAGLEKYSSIKDSFAFSSDSFFQNQKYSRQVEKINFSSREDLRIGQLNTLSYNLRFDKHLRRILPYYVFFEIPEMAKGSTVCSSGNLFYYLSINKSLNKNLKNLNFIKNPNHNCFDFNNEHNKLYLIGYSINDEDNLSIYLKKNIILNILEYYKYFTVFLILLIYLYSFSKFNFTSNFYIYLISFVSTIILTLIRDSNIITGLRYFRGGSDGLMHYSYGRDIVQNILNGEYLLSLRGGEDIFYFMPGLRYFGALSNILFGDTSYGYLLMCTFIPFIIYNFFKLLINEKYSTYLFISFIFVPIFENMGFGYFNYVWQFARNHAESLSILLILYSLFEILKISKHRSCTIFSSLSIGLALSCASFLRPNFFPTTLILYLYLCYLLYCNSQLICLLLITFSYSLIFGSFFHNIYFGNDLVFFTNAYVNFRLNINSFFDGLFALIYFNFENNNLQIIFSQFLLWNPIYNIHRIIILIFIAINVLINKQKLFVYVLFLCMISQHGVLILTQPSSRYAYLAWLLTIILFFVFENQHRLLHKIFNKIKN